MFIVLYRTFIGFFSIVLAYLVIRLLQTLFGYFEASGINMMAATGILILSTVLSYIVGYAIDYPLDHATYRKMPRR